MKVRAICDRTTGLNHWAMIVYSGGRTDLPTACGLNVSVTLPDDARPPDEITCPSCQVEFVADRLLNSDGGCWFCGGGGKLSSISSKPGGTCPECNGTGTAQGTKL